MAHDRLAGIYSHTIGLVLHTWLGRGTWKVKGTCLYQFSQGEVVQPIRAMKRITSRKMLVIIGRSWFRQFSVAGQANRLHPLVERAGPHDPGLSLAGNREGSGGPRHLYSN